MLIEWTDPALDDMETIRDYIALDSPQNARQVMLRLFEAAERLADFPMIGRTMPKSKKKGVRELIVKPYRLVYQANTNPILILAVLHGSRDIKHMGTAAWL